MNINIDKKIGAEHQEMTKLTFLVEFEQNEEKWHVSGWW